MSDTLFMCTTNYMSDKAVRAMQWLIYWWWSTTITLIYCFNKQYTWQTKSHRPCRLITILALDVRLCCFYLKTLKSQLCSINLKRARFRLYGAIWLHLDNLSYYIRLHGALKLTPWTQTTIWEYCSYFKKRMFPFIYSPILKPTTSMYLFI